MIRLATPDEWARVRELRLRALASDPSAFGSTFARDAALPEAEWRARIGANAYFVVERGGGFAGMAVLRPVEEAEIVGLWVAPEARGAGHAKALLRAACDEARTRGYATIHLWSNATNDAALRLYERLGFARVGAPLNNPDGRVFQRLDRTIR